MGNDVAIEKILAKAVFVAKQLFNKLLFVLVQFVFVEGFQIVVALCH